MDWKDEEVKAGQKAAREHSMWLPEAVVRAVMSRAVELAAARGGTMTEVDLDEMVRNYDGDGPNHFNIRRLLQHISTQGARVAVLEKEQNDAFDLLGRLRSVDEQYSEETKLRERLHSAEESVRELTRRAQQAEAERDAAKSAAKEWERLRNDAYRQFRDAAHERDELKARCAALSAAGHVLSQHVDKARAVCERLFYWLAMGDEGPESELPCPEEIAELPNPIAELLEEARVAARGLGGLKDEDENHARYPCSPTCTHDDAAKPGHMERVKERSEAVKERKCRYRECGALFKPRTHAQAYCCPRHKDQENDRLEYERKPKRAKQNGPKAGFKEEINTIAPLERQWAKAATKADLYAPLMGEALYEITMRLMRKEAA